MFVIKVFKNGVFQGFVSCVSTFRFKYYLTSDMFKAKKYKTLDLVFSDIDFCQRIIGFDTSITFTYEGIPK